MILGVTFGWSCAILSLLAISNGLARSPDASNISKELPTRPDYEVNVWLDSSYDEGRSGKTNKNDLDEAPSSPGNRMISFFREYFMGILLGSLLIVVFGGCICWCRWQEAKYGEYGEGARQRKFDVQTVRRGPGCDLEGYRESYDRLTQSRAIMNGDMLVVHGGKYAQILKVQKPEDSTPNASSGAFRQLPPPTASEKIGLHCKLKCAGGGGSCGGESSVSRGIAKRLAFEAIRESYGPPTAK